MNTEEIEIRSPVESKMIADPEVKITASGRRYFSTAYKKKILAHYEACQDTESRNGLLRREGLYHSRLSSWRKQLKHGTLGNKKSGSTKLHQQVTKLERENVMLKKKLSQAEAVISLQKKVSELLGQHILPAEMSEVS